MTTLTAEILLLKKILCNPNYFVAIYYSLQLLSHIFPKCLFFPEDGDDKILRKAGTTRPMS
jgi:hypothetical protein